MSFIPIDKMKQLREAAKNGDERAKHILRAQLDNVNFKNDLDDYFSESKQDVVEKTNLDNNTSEDTRLQKFLKYNNVTKDDPEYESTLEAYYKEFPQEKTANVQSDLNSNNNEDNFSIYGEEDEPINQDDNLMQSQKYECFIDPLISDEIEAINGYNKAIMEVMNEDDQNEAEKKGIIADLEDIKREEIEHLDRLKRMKSSIFKKHKKELNIIE